MTSPFFNANLDLLFSLTRFFFDKGLLYRFHNTFFYFFYLFSQIWLRCILHFLFINFYFYFLFLFFFISFFHFYFLNFLFFQTWLVLYLQLGLGYTYKWPPKICQSTGPGRFQRGRNFFTYDVDGVDSFSSSVSTGLTLYFLNTLQIIHVFIDLRNGAQCFPDLFCTGSLIFFSSKRGKQNFFRAYNNNLPDPEYR